MVAASRVHVASLSLRRLLMCAWALAVVAQEGADQGARLLQVQLVTRHGAREELSKDPSTLGEGGAQLTAEGESQMVGLGAQLRAHYLLPPGALLPELTAYSAEDVWLLSSAPDRAIASAMSLVDGLWPPSNGDQYEATQVPVHSLPARHDITIRAYHSCPAYHDDLEALYTSRAFEEEEGRSLSLLETLAEEFPSEAVVDAEEQVAYVPLNRLWNVFDQLHVTQGTMGPSPELRSLASWVEHQRFSQTTAGSKLGANLWTEIMQRAESVVASVQSATSPSVTLAPAVSLHPPHKLVAYSAHYPTILSLLSALTLFTHNPTLLSEGQEIPDYAAALIVELWQWTSSTTPENTPTNPDERAVYLRVRYKHDLTINVDTAPYLNLGPPCDVASQERGYPQPSCPLGVFVSSATNIPGWPADTAEWCVECRNTRSAECMDAAMSAGEGSEASKTDPGTNPMGDQGPLYFVLLVLGVAVGAAVGVAVGCWWHQRRAAKRGSDPDAQAMRDSSVELSAPLETKV